MSIFLNPNDWLGRHPAICLVVIGALTFLVAAL